MSKQFKFDLDSMWGLRGFNGQMLLDEATTYLASAVDLACICVHSDTCILLEETACILFLEWTGCMLRKATTCILVEETACMQVVVDNFACKLPVGNISALLLCGDNFQASDFLVFLFLASQNSSQAVVVHLCSLFFCLSFFFYPKETQIQSNWNVVIMKVLHILNKIQCICVLSKCSVSQGMGKLSVIEGPPLSIYKAMLAPLITNHWVGFPIGWDTRISDTYVLRDPGLSESPNVFSLCEYP